MAAKKRNIPWWVWPLTFGSLGLALYLIARPKKNESLLLLPSVPGPPAPAPGPCVSPGQSSPTPSGVPSAEVLKSATFLRNIFGLLTTHYGAAISKNVEKIYRLETANFSSGQYLASGSAGMTAPVSVYPYGWSSLAGFWGVNPGSGPVGVVHWCVRGSDGNLKQYSYICFSAGWGFVALAEILKARGNDPGRWYSSLPGPQAEYREKINRINTTYA